MYRFIEYSDNTERLAWFVTLNTKSLNEVASWYQAGYLSRQLIKKFGNGLIVGFISNLDLVKNEKYILVLEPAESGFVKIDIAFDSTDYVASYYQAFTIKISASTWAELFNLVVTYRIVEINKTKPIIKKLFPNYTSSGIFVKKRLTDLIS